SSETSYESALIDIDVDTWTFELRDTIPCNDAAVLPLGDMQMSAWCRMEPTKRFVCRHGTCTPQSVDSDAVVVDALDQVLDRGNGALAGLVFGPDPFDPLQLSHLVLENYVQGSTSPSPIASDAWCPLAMFADPLDPSTVRIA